MRITVTYSSPLKTTLFLCLVIFISMFHESEKVAHFASGKLADKSFSSDAGFYRGLLYFSEKMGDLKELTGLNAFYKKEKKFLTNLEESPVLFRKNPPAEVEIKKDPEKIEKGNNTEIAETDIKDAEKVEIKKKKVVKKSVIRGFSPPYRFLFVGDSMVQSPLGIDLEKRLMSIKRSYVTKKGVVSSGLLRPDYFNWYEKLARYIGIYRPTVLVIMLGTNDISSLYNPEETRFYSFNSPKMKALYRRNVKRLMQLSKRRNLKTFWIGLPGTEKSEVNEKLEIINSIHESVAGEFDNVYYIKTWDLFRNSDESVRKFITANGRKTKIRSSDGVHYTEAGGAFAGNFIFRSISGTIKSNIAEPPVRYAQIQKRELRSASLKKRVEFDVYIPQKSDDVNTEKFPLIFLMGGIGKNNLSFFRKNEKYLKWLSQKYRSILVTPGKTTLWASSSNKKINKWFIKELLPEVLALFPTDGRISVIGINEGGGGAIKLSLEAPDKFVSVSAINGLFHHKKRFVKEKFLIGERVPFPFKTRILVTHRKRSRGSVAFKNRSYDLLIRKKIKTTDYSNDKSSLYRYLLVEIKKHLKYHLAAMEFRDIKPGDTDHANDMFVKSIKNGYSDIIRDLLMKNIGVNKKDERGTTPLIAAARYKRFKTLAVLIDNNARIDLKDNSGRTALIHAAIRGANNIVSLLIKKGASVDARDGSRSTALIYAAQRGFKDTVKLLLKNGADVNALNISSVSPLMKAVKYKHIKVAKLLLDKGADVNVKDKLGWTALMKSSLEGDYEMTSLLIKRGADLNVRDDQGRTPVMAASWKGNGKIVRLLVEKGAKIGLKDKDGETSLIKAVKYNKKDVVKFLLTKKPDVNEPDFSKATPLIHCAKSGLYHMGKILLKAGADIEKRYKNGWTPLHIASMKGHRRVVDLLLKNGADFNAVSETNKTPVFYAVNEAHLDIVKLLLNYGADTTVTDEKGKTPLYYAIINRLEKIAELIIVKGKLPGGNSGYLNTALGNTGSKGLASLIETVKIIRKADEKLYKGDFREALTFYQKAFEIEKKKKRNSVMPDILSSIARCYSKMNDFSKTIEYYRKTIKYPERKELIAENLNNMGKTCFSKRKYVSAVNFLTGSIMLSEEIDRIVKGYSEKNLNRIFVVDIKKQGESEKEKPGLNNFKCRRISYESKELKNLISWAGISKHRTSIGENQLIFLFINYPHYDLQLFLTKNDVFCRNSKGLFVKTDRDKYRLYKTEFLKKYNFTKRKRDHITTKRSERFNRLLDINYNLKVDPKIEGSFDSKTIGKLFFGSLKG